MQRAWRDMNRTILGMLGLLLACVASMAIGFFVFQYAASGLLVPAVHEEARIDEARALRQHANALILLTSSFLNAYRGEPERFEPWLDEVFRPGVTRAQRAIRSQRQDGHAQAQLIAAANLLVQLAERPDSDERREQATRRVLDAAAAAEERIGELGVAPFLDEPAQLLQFRLYGQ